MANLTNLTRKLGGEGGNIGSVVRALGGEGANLDALTRNASGGGGGKNVDCYFITGVSGVPTFDTDVVLHKWTIEEYVNDAPYTVVTLEQTHIGPRSDIEAWHAALDTSFVYQLANDSGKYMLGDNPTPNIMFNSSIDAEASAFVTYDIQSETFMIAAAPVAIHTSSWQKNVS